jgi:predicted dehydrogenase
MKTSSDPSRRAIVKTGTAIPLGAALAAKFARLGRARAAAPADAIRVGLVGCGGRGTGAAAQAVKAAPGVRLVAMGDLFKDRLVQAREALAKKDLGEGFAVTDQTCFVGWDAYRQVIDAGVDYVILASPPGFRPAHLDAAIRADKHVFTEKPVAVDAAGVRMCLALAEEATRRKLGVGVGLQRRHHAGYIELMKRIKGGAIGKIVGGRCSWLQGSLWMKPREPAWTDTEWQVRNWLYFSWLSGDHIVEQHIHNVDIINWAIGKPPVAAIGMGGRQQRTEGAYGHIYDHFAIDLEYPDGVHVTSMTRQIPRCHNDVSEHLVGTLGTADADNRNFTISGKKKWLFDGDGKTTADPYQQEHVDLIASIRKGQPLNELRSATESNLAVIMARMSAYSGQRVTWEQALASPEDLTPKELKFGPLAVPEVAMPGRTRAI